MGFLLFINCNTFVVWAFATLFISFIFENKIIAIDKEYYNNYYYNYYFYLTNRLKIILVDLFQIQRYD